MKLKIILFLFIISFSSYSQVFKKNAIYFVGRGTLSKKELIGDRFNKYNKQLTHLGLGIVINDTLMIYNVSSDKIINKSALIVEKVSNFKNVNDIFYFGIWEYQCDKKTINDIKKELISIQKEQIIFDRKFILNDDNNLYCSEFVYNITKKIKGFDIKPNTIELNKIEKQILNVEKLSYISVDYFLSNKDVKEIHTENLN